MRCYVGVTIKDLERFLATASLVVPHVLASTSDFRNEYVDEDEEEIEFELSLKAAEHSRKLQDSSNAIGFILALEMDSHDLGTEEGYFVEAKKPLMWSQVEALLISDSFEPELSWYAPEEVAIYLPSWLS